MSKTCADILHFSVFLFIIESMRKIYPNGGIAAVSYMEGAFMADCWNKNYPFALPFILDGATGTELTRRGMPEGGCTEQFILEHPQILTDLQNEYRKAGSDAVLAPTFGANRPTLERHGFSTEDADELCTRLYRIAKDAAGDSKVGGDMSPTGLLLKPYGDADPETVYEIYTEQAKTLLACGVDFIWIETMISAAEARLAVRAVRDLSADIPVYVSLTVNENGRTMNGDAPEAALLTMVPYHIQGFGCNCSIGPDVILNALRPAAPIAKLYGIPLIAKPNAGMPVTDENGTHFPLTPSDMAAYAERLTGIGVGIFGGCCGTTPAHIETIAKAAKSTAKERFSDVETAEDGVYVSTARVFALTDPDAVYTPVDADGEDDLYELMDECDAEDILYLELGEGAGELLVRMDAFIPNPIAVRGDEKEIAVIEKNLCRKVR